MPGLREALEESYDTLAEGGTPAPVEAAEPAVEAPAEETPESQAPETDRARDEQGRFAKQEQSAPAQEAPPPIAPVLPAAPAFKAPPTWKPGVREKWAGLPAEVQAEVARREREVSQALQQSAEERKTAQAYQETIRPYEAQIRATGQKPEQYVGTLLQTAHALFYGPPHQKAPLLADLIMQAGVPPEDLDRALVARMNGQQAPQQGNAQYRDPRVDQLLQQLETAKKEQTTARAAEADSAANGFADSHEFFDDVAEDVADLLDVWAKKGKKEVSAEDLERAYTIACQNHPDVSPIFSQRQAQTAARTAQAVTVRARAAASSVRNQPTSAAAAQATGRRAVLEERYDELDQ